jgi:predicted transcriptional regulator
MPRIESTSELAHRGRLKRLRDAQRRRMAPDPSDEERREEPDRKAHWETYTLEEVKAALIEANGTQTVAAKLLGCHRNTVGKYLKRYPDLRGEIVSMDESVTDVAEQKLRKAVEAGEPWAVRLQLRTKGRERGYRYHDGDGSGLSPYFGDGDGEDSEGDGRRGIEEITGALARIKERLGPE